MPTPHYRQAGQSSLRLLAVPLKMGRSFSTHFSQAMARHPPAGAQHLDFTRNGSSFSASSFLGSSWSFGMRSGRFSIQCRLASIQMQDYMYLQARWITPWARTRILTSQKKRSRFTFSWSPTLTFLMFLHPHLRLHTSPFIRPRIASNTNRHHEGTIGSINSRRSL